MVHSPSVLPSPLPTDINCKSDFYSLWFSWLTGRQISRINHSHAIGMDIGFKTSPSFICSSNYLELSKRALWCPARDVRTHFTRGKIPVAVVRLQLKRIKEHSHWHKNSIALISLSSSSSSSKDWYALTKKWKSTLTRINQLTYCQSFISRSQTMNQSDVWGGKDGNEPYHTLTQYYISLSS